jgi:hypothetical protein
VRVGRWNSVLLETGQLETGQLETGQRDSHEFYVSHRMGISIKLELFHFSRGDS